MSDQFTVGVRFDLDLDAAERQLDDLVELLRRRLQTATTDTEADARDMGDAYVRAGTDGARAVDKVTAAVDRAGTETAKAGAKSAAGFKQMSLFADGAIQSVAGVGATAEATGRRAATSSKEAATAVTAVGERARDASGKFLSMGASADGAGKSVSGLGGHASNLAGHIGRLGAGGAGVIGGLAEAAGRGAVKFGEMALNVGKIATVVVGGGLAALTGVGLKTAASLEMAQTGFGALLGGAEQGQQFFKGLVGVANQSAFEVGQLTGPAQTLLAVFKGDGAQATEALKTMGDGVALLGKNSPEALGRLADGFGKMSSQGKVGMESLNIIGEALPGFSARTALAEGYAERFGGTAEQAMKKISEGTIDAQTGTEILLGKMREFPGLSGAMIAQSKTLSGVLSTFADTFKSSLAFDLAGPLIEPVKTAVLGLNDVIGPALSGLGAAIAPVAAQVLPDLLSGIGPLISQLPAILGPLAQGFGALVSSLSPVLQDLAVVLVPVAQNIGELLTQVAPDITPILQAIVGFIPSLASVFDIIGTVIANASPGIAGLLGAIGNAFNAFAPIIQQVASAFGGLVAEIADALIPMIDGLVPVMAVVGQVIGDVFTALAPVFADLVRALAPVVTTIGQGLGRVLVAVAPLLVHLATLFAQIITAALPIVDALLGPLISVFTALIPPIDALIVALAPLIVQFVEMLAPVIGQVAGVLGTLLVAAIQLLAPLLPPLAGAVLQIVTAFMPLLPVIGDLLVSLLPPLVQILTALTPVIDVVAAAVSKFAGIMSAEISTAIGIITPILNDITPILQGISDFLTNVFQGDWSKAWDSIKETAEKAINLVKDTFNGVITWFEGLGDRIGKALVGAFKTGWNWLADHFSVTLPSFEVFGKQIGGGEISLPRLAKGMYATSPTVGVFGEAGSELVVPVANQGAAAALARSYPRPAAQAAFSLLSGLGLAAPTAAGGAGAVTVNASVTVAGNVYGVDDLDRYMDARDAQLARLLTSRVGAR